MTSPAMQNLSQAKLGDGLRIVGNDLKEPGAVEVFRGRIVGVERTTRIFGGRDHLVFVLDGTREGGGGEVFGDEQVRVVVMYALFALTEVFAAFPEFEPGDDFDRLKDLCQDAIVEVTATAYASATAKLNGAPAVRVKFAWRRV